MKERALKARQRGQDLWSVARVFRIDKSGHVSVIISRTHQDINRVRVWLEPLLTVCLGDPL